MPIPESQLDTWSHQGATTTAKATHLSIRAALAANSSPIKDKIANGDAEVFLQGSYKNDTNIRGDSDVDVVVQLNSSWGRDLSALPEEQKRLYHAAYPNAKYLWQHFRGDVMKALRAYYGPGPIKEGNKSIKLAAAPSRLAADIVVALHFRKYAYFYGDAVQSFVDGVKFQARNEGREIINFPKPHYDNGVAKNSQAKTNGWYKPTVRMFKNARTYLVDQGTIADELAPSYFLECLLYNAPDNSFGTSFDDTFVEVFNWLWSEAPAAQLYSQNEQTLLFGNTPEQWNQSDAKQLLEGLKELWDNW